MSNIEKLLPLLSDGLRDILVQINKKYKSEIAYTLLECDSFIESHNTLIEDIDYDSNKKEQYLSTCEFLKKNIDSAINNEARMLSIRFDSFEISYLPKGKTPIYTDSKSWSRLNRQSAKPARIIQKLLIKKYSCKDFENFNNWIKSELFNIGQFEIVEGGDIRKYYLEDNYYKCTGSLGNSCMRYEECQPYFDIYVDCAKMLILRKNDKILGRAILWEINNKIYMDRVYTCLEYLENSFISYAEKNKWYYRETQSILYDNNFQAWLGPEDDYKNPFKETLTIYLPTEYSYMPYLDSFRYYNGIKNSINTNPKDGTSLLSNTDGDYSLNEFYTFSCNRCGIEERVPAGTDPRDLNWSDYDGCWYCPDCCMFCSGIDDFVSIDTDIVGVFSPNGEQEAYPTQYVMNNPDIFIQIHNVWHFKSDCIQDAEGNYKLKDE